MLKTLTDDIFVAPQISVADVEEAKALGVKLVINNRPDHESPDQPEGNEIEEAARAAGMAYAAIPATHAGFSRSEEHASELQSLMRIYNSVLCVKKQQNR